ncbi:MAG TPA: LysR family transcriptional regulator [Streptosporangiaceae bacterium]|jgi:DNA-binding transcriptional LysR family regulator
MLDVTRLRVLAAVARHGSVTAAARALNYAQPSVSHHLARLEAETGARLIQRSGRGIRLTDAGRLLAGRAEEILGRLDAAEQELATHMGQRAQRIRLAGFPTALATLVPAAAARLRVSHPGIELLLAESEPLAALRMLRGGHVDVAVVFRYAQEGMVIGPPLDEEDGTRSTLLLREPVHLVTGGQAAAGGSGQAPPGGSGQGAAGGSGQGAASGSGQRAAGMLAGYAGHRWIAGCERCRAHLLWQCEVAGFTPQIAFTTDDVMVAQALAAAGLGVALLPDLALRVVRHRGIHAEPLPGASREILALTYGEPPDPTAVEHLINALTQASPEGSLPRTA